MAKEKKSGQTDKRQIALIAYLALGVAMILTTLLLAFTAEGPAMAQVTQAAPTQTLSPLILTQQADYVTIDPDEHHGGGGGSGAGGGRHTQDTSTPTVQATMAPSGENHDTTH